MSTYGRSVHGLGNSEPLLDFPMHAFSVVAILDNSMMPQNSSQPPLTLSKEKDRERRKEREGEGLALNTQDILKT